MNRLAESLAARLPGALEAIYLYGSTALGAYVEGSSDIDFIAVVRRAPARSDMQAIAEAHGEIERELAGTDLMGAYITRNDLGKQPPELSGFLTYFNKQLHDDGTGADLNPVTWWVLQKHGIRVYGDDVPFAYEVPEDKLADYVIDNMNTYWAGWIDRLAQHESKQPAELDTQAQRLDQAVEWCVLGMLRQLYTVSECGVTGKIGAGTYGLTVLPERWHPLIREAMAIKRRRAEREYGSQQARLRDLVELLRAIRTEGNRIYHTRRR
ncbi:hypothetical protein SD70_03005 [Gordoniibacillus kamchatkensis]|uniref:Nucleotidyltransferase n=2 Tax=Gordoniibacillus kamchatkensis TaxID=1590651 RepID=A0ABR5AMD0_9BACL|nr:hypothetical protein SD70_03005 [Paenibacillus sp. VKM B-2647]